MTRGLADWCDGFVKSVVVGKDIIARLSLHSLECLRDAAVTTGCEAGTSKLGLVFQAVGLANPLCCPPPITLTGHEEVFSKLSSDPESGVSSTTQLAMTPQCKDLHRQYSFCRDEQRSQRPAPRMFPPGKILHLATRHRFGAKSINGICHAACVKYLRGGCCCCCPRDSEAVAFDRRVDAAFNFAAERSSTRGESEVGGVLEPWDGWYHGEVSQKGIRQLRPEWSPERSDYEEVILGHRILLDHFPDVVAAAIERCVAIYVCPYAVAADEEKIKGRLHP
jgi:hypothetical protein